jgi:CHAD domain-containing protein
MSVRRAQRTAAEPFILFAHATLQREAAALAGNRPAGARSPTPEQIHQLRVAARRLRVALKLFARFLPRRDVARFGTDLRWFAASLGEVRDLDVYAANFKAYARTLPAERRAELGGYELYLRRERAAARKRATAAFGSARTAALFTDLARFVAKAPSAGALRRWRALNVGDAVRESMRRSAGRVRRLGDTLSQRAARAPELHALRIKTKRLRYELEFFTKVYPQLTEPAAKCKALQDLLGTHQDAYTATARLRRYAALLRKQGEPAALPPALVELRKSQLHSARVVRRTFRAQWPAFVATIDGARQALG